jgi:hypothetical protein
MSNSFASRLLNYVEPVNYNGVFKTALYSEYGTNFKIGDKVFIINGNYDSNNFISSGTFSTNTDGYTILDIDKCRIVLDINYTGQSTYNQDSLDNYVRLQTITSQRDFDYINAININSYGTFSSKFEYKLSNDIIFANGAFLGTTSVFGFNNGITHSGFYQKQTTTNNWVDITASFSAGIIGFKTTGGYPTYSLTYNNRILIVGEDITFNNITYKQRGIYLYDNTLNRWSLDETSNTAFITKLNFRNGKFNGTWNDGVFGSYDRIINWDNDSAIWNSGVFLNSNWKKGTINSRNTPNTQKTNYVNPLFNASFTSTLTASYNILTINTGTISRTIDYNNPVKQSNNTLTISYYSKIDSTSGLPLQSTDYSNNRGYGFNYIIDSNIETGNIVNGNFENCNIGLTNYGINSLDVYYGTPFTYSIQISGGNYNLCDINTAAFNNSTIVNSNINNSNILNSKLSSNQVYNTAASGEYNTDNSINIINADLWSYIPSNSTQKRGVLKLFIDSKDLTKLTDFESIYIDNINKDVYLSSFHDDSKVHLNIENKYILDNFHNSEITSTTGSILVSLKTPTDNTYKSYIYKSGLTYSNAYVPNPNGNYASIDIDLSETLAWYTDGTSSFYVNSNPIITTDNVSNLFTNTNVINSDFNSGILVDSTWKNGNNYNDISNYVIKSGGSYSIKVISGSTNSISIDISNNTYNKYYNLNIGDYIWLNGLDYATNSIAILVSNTLTNATFKVTATATPVLSSSRRFILTELTNNIFNGSMTASGRFFVNGLYPNYFSINTFKIDNSIINGGDFKSTLIVNSTIINNDFNNLDKTLTLSNINKLKFINILFKDDNNIINSGLIYNSHIINTTWNNGISFNSVAKNATFSNGIFKNGYWVSGAFNNGVFSDSSATSPTISSFELSSQYRSWRNGVFNNGQLYTSVWIDGTFNSGKFYNAHWYGGIWNNGILGIKNTQYYNTTLGYYQNIGTGSTATTWYYGTVESAIIGGSSIVNWNDGIFNNGEFTSAGGSYSSTWLQGSFNGGKFTNNAKWKNGIFNNGKFLSYFGWSMSNSTQSSNYSWENGKFNGGQFGQPNVATNSTWYNGEFNDGYFYGRVWNYGIFTKGNFYGSSLTASYQNEQNFMNYYTSSYYGLWRDGYLVDSIHIGDPNQKIYTNLKRATDNKKPTNTATLQNMLWLNGTFSHANGIAENIVWLNGSFMKGQFNDSAFNPYVDRTLHGSTLSASQSFNFNNSCKWYNGTFNGGTFYISEWKDGLFQSGYMLGGIWRSGTWYYGSAVNCYWESGTWKNGNWYGTNFDDSTIATASLSVNNLQTKYVLYNIANVLGTSSIHLLNAFTGSTSPEILYDPAFAKEAVGDYHGWTQSGSTPWVWANSYANTIHFGSYTFTTIVSANNYQFNGSGQSNTLFGLSQSGAGFTTSIFIPFKAYNIAVSVHVNYPGGVTTYPTQLEFFLGYTSSIVNCSQGTNNFFFSLTSDPAAWTASFYPNFGITKLTEIPSVTTALLNVSIKSTNVSYDFIHNNSQYTPYSLSPTFSATVSLPGIVPTTVADNGEVHIQYGNGRFISGVWENGVWNNGWRNDTTLTRCVFYPISSYIKMSSKTHRIQLQFLDQTQSLYRVGDSVSVGNIVSIDINGTRKLIKDKFKVIFIGSTNIVLEIDINFPITEIIQDSNLHLIYLTKNIWLSGAFLNGYFNGVWNYGLFKGFPYITYMKDSHFIDGIFDGGHFLSTTASGPSGSSYTQYNTGVIQNFQFNDNNRAIITPTMDRSTNVITRLNSYKYDSWIDVNYVLDSQTNIYQDQNVYSDTIGLGLYFHGVISKANLNGLITYDVLSSKSNFRNGYDNNIKTYNLGIKYTKYINYLDQIGDFNTLFSNRIPALGMSNFINDGWTFSSLIAGVYGTYVYGGNTLLNSTDFQLFNEDNTFNFISTTYAIPISIGGLTGFPSTSLQQYVLLDNTNTFDIPSQRYSMYEYEVLSFTGFAGPDAYTSRSFADNSLGSYYPPAISSLMLPATWSTTQLVPNPLWKTNTDTTKREFFYNRHGLEMMIEAGSILGIEPYPMKLKFGNINFYEIDMIPFFSYTGGTTSYIDRDIRLPWVATAPYIDYTSSSFDYIGNIVITVDSSLIEGGITTYTPPSPGGIFAIYAPLPPAF